MTKRTAFKYVLLFAFILQSAAARTPNAGAFRASWWAWRDQRRIRCLYRPDGFWQRL